jgi:hypothetical protein
MASTVSLASECSSTLLDLTMDLYIDRGQSDVAVAAKGVAARDVGNVVADDYVPAARLPVCSGHGHMWGLVGQARRVGAAQCR